MLGWGRLTFWSPTDDAIALAVKYEIYSTGFTFTRLDGSTQRNSAQSLAGFLNLLAPPVDSSKYQASAVLSALPASPYDAFYGSTPTGAAPTGPEVAFTFGPNQLELLIKTPDALKDQPFAASPHNQTYFKALNLTITETLDSQTMKSQGIKVKGGVVAMVLSESINLTAALDGDQLIFTKTDPVTLTLPIQGWGTMDIASMMVKPTAPNITGLQARYTFDEGRGDRIYDCAASDAPIDLTVKTAMPDTAAWEKVGNLRLKTVVQNEEVVKAPLLSSDRDEQSEEESSASRLIQACISTDELTIAAWIKPEQAKQKGPARIVALSHDTGNRHFMLGHGVDSEEGSETDKYRARIKTNYDDGENDYTTGSSQFYTQPGTATENLTYLVYAHSKDDGSSKNARFYINGILEEFSEDTQLPEGFPDDEIWGPKLIRGEIVEEEENGAWEDSSDYKLVVGNVASFEQEEDEVDHNRAWVGELHRIDLYNRALSAAEIHQQYYPNFEAVGQFRLHNGPAPLDTPLPATLTLEPGGGNTLQLTVQESAQRTVTPQFQFTSINGVWRRTLTGNQGFVLASGQINTVLWGNAIAFTLTGESTGQSGRFELHALSVADQAAILQAAANQVDTEVDLKLKGLNTLTFVTILAESLDPSGLQPPWRLQSTTDMKEVLLPRLRDGRPFDWAVDFKLLSPALGIEKGQVVLKGTWLDQPLSLYGGLRNGQFLMQGESLFSLPFQITLGPIFEPGAPYKILETVKIVSVMNTTLTLELTKLGFLAHVSAGFEWTDAGGTAQTFTMPAFTLSRPPLTPNQILSAVLERLTAQADVIFAGQFRHAADYSFEKVGAKTLIYLGDRTASAAQTQTATLPQLFTVANARANQAASAGGIFSLEEQQRDQSCKLTIKPGVTPIDPAAIKIDYADFMNKLEAQQNLIPGALTLVKTRIAERLPLPVEETLYYYYGLDPNTKSLDLQPGMRLRVDYQNYQFVHPAQSTANSGFVGSGTSYYSLTSYSAQAAPATALINFDAFLSQIQPYVVTDIAKLGAGSSLDTFRAGYQKSYFRLVYPSQAALSAGSLEIGQAATLIAAAKLTELDAQKDVATFYFRGRATVIPEITVMLQGHPVFVPVGTTLRQLMEQTVSLASALPGQSLVNSTGKPRLSRVVHEGVSNQPSYRFIKLAEAEAKGVPFFDLPLVKGDRIAL